MLIIPAIDILGGRCVRLLQGDYNQVSEYGDRLHDIARRWVDAGASRIHLVDLDGAKAGEPVNHQAILDLARDFPQISFEVGGGIRDMRHAQDYLEQGVDFVILGSVAYKDPDAALAIIRRFPGRVLLGLDSQGGRVKIAGWLDDTGKSLTQVLAPFLASPQAGVIHTDIARDGTLDGANLAASAELARTSGLQVIASGGVASLADVEKLGAYAGLLQGVITGKALYEGRLSLADAIARATEIA